MEPDSRPRTPTSAPTPARQQRHHHPARCDAPGLPRDGPSPRRRRLVRRASHPRRGREPGPELRRVRAGGPRSTFVEKDVRRAADHVAPSTDVSTPGGIVSQRTYRLALVTDPGYAAFFGPTATHAASDPLVLAAKAVLINRVNEVYNDDVAYKFVLITGTDKLNLLDAAEMSGTNGPCGVRACFPDATGSYGCGNVLDDNVLALGQLVGADNFDIGHIGLGVNGGGIGASASWARPTRLWAAPASRPRPGSLRDRLRRPRDGPPDGWRPHLQRHRGQLQRGQPQQPDRRRARLRCHDHGLRRHLRLRQPAAAQRPLLLLPQHRRVRGHHGRPSRQRAREAGREPVHVRRHRLVHAQLQRLRDLRHVRERPKYNAAGLAAAVLAGDRAGGNHHLARRRRRTERGRIHRYLGRHHRRSRP